MSKRGAHVAPAAISKLSGPRCWRWANPRPRNDSYRDSGSDAAKYSATSRSGKGIVSRIDGQCPNVSADRNEAAANISPRSTVICRPENAAGSGCNNVTDSVKCYPVSVECSKTVILFCARIAVISRSEHATALTHDRTGRSKHVADVIDPQPWQCQWMLGLC